MERLAPELNIIRFSSINNDINDDPLTLRVEVISSLTKHTQIPSHIHIHIIEMLGDEKVFVPLSAE